MDVTIRSERTSDYSGITDLTYNAFVGWHPADFMAEPLLVDVLRHNAMFDPDLSLVAEHEGRIVGHALFSPFEFIVLGTRQVGIVLAPIGVEPAFQRAGIGKMLIEKGHEVAARKGYAFSLLCGHPEYYPKFGYRQRMFALSGAKVILGPGNAGAGDLEEHPVLTSDLDWITDAWMRQHGSDDLALFPGVTIGQWMNHSPNCRSSTITQGGEVVAYVRYGRSYPVAIRELLVEEGRARDVLSFLLRRYHDRDAGEFSLPFRAATLDPWLVPGDEVTASGDGGTADAFMLRALDEGSPIARYGVEVSEGRRRPGIIAFPPMLDVDG